MIKTFEQYKDKKIQKVYATQDESWHWYVIPFDLHNEFLRISEELEKTNYEDCSEFDEKFGQYLTGGDLNNVQLYAKL